MVQAGADSLKAYCNAPTPVDERPAGEAPTLLGLGLSSASASFTESSQREDNMPWPSRSLSVAAAEVTEGKVAEAVVYVMLCGSDIVDLVGLEVSLVMAYRIQKCFSQKMTMEDMMTVRFLVVSLKNKGGWWHRGLTFAEISWPVVVNDVDAV